MHNVSVFINTKTLCNNLSVYYRYFNQSILTKIYLKYIYYKYTKNTFTYYILNINTLILYFWYTKLVDLKSAKLDFSYPEVYLVVLKWNYCK